jgi:hypothetical protein
MVFSVANFRHFVTKKKRVGESNKGNFGNFFFNFEKRSTCPLGQLPFIAK